MFVAGYADGALQVCSVSGISTVVHAHTSPLVALRWSPGGLYIATAAINDSKLKLWRWGEGYSLEEYCSLDAGTQGITSFECYTDNPEGTIIAG